MSRPSNNHGFQSVRAFTLIELLIVVGIIAILASLLSASVTRGKHSARLIVCSGNLRQLGLAAQMYWDDNLGKTFRYRTGSTNGGDVYWFGWLERGAEGQRRFDRAAGALGPYLAGKGVDTCASLNYSMRQFKLKAVGAAFGYGYNLHLSAPLTEPAFAISRLRRPSGIALLADCAQVNTFQAPASVDNPMLEEFYYVATNAMTAHFRHNRQASVVHCDGHVGTERLAPGAEDGRMAAAKVGMLRADLLDELGR